MKTYQDDRKPEAYWIKVHQRMKVAKAVKVINHTLSCPDDVSMKQLRAAEFIINKVCPQFQAIAVKHESNEPATLGQIEALLLQSGVDPKSVLPTPDGVPRETSEPIDVTPEEKTVSDQELIEGPGTPDMRE